MSKGFSQATIRINGKPLTSEKGATIDFGGVKRTTKVVGKKTFYTEETMQAKVECSVMLENGISITDIQNFADGTVLFETDVGKIFTIPNAHVTDTLNASDSDGMVKIVIEGDPAVERG